MWVQEGLVLRCDIFWEEGSLPLRLAYITTDEAQRLFSCLDTDHKGYLVLDDLLRWGVPKEHARKVWERFHKYGDHVNFNDFQRELDAVRTHTHTHNKKYLFK